MNWAFHTALCESARRPRMMAILLSLYTATDRYLRLQIARPQAKVKALDDHRAIYEAFKVGRAAAASKLIRAHITGAYDDVVAQLKQRAKLEAPEKKRRRADQSSVSSLAR